MKRRLLLALACLALASPLAAEIDPEALRQAKALFFDRKYQDSRAAWQQILTEAEGADADAAAYWVARCSEKLGEDERALREYAAYLARGPKDPTLVEEARTSRVSLAAQLYKEGQTRHLDVLKGALASASPTVRYYAALEVAGLGPEVGRLAIPVLKQILAHETDPDLVDRARLALLRVDPSALGSAAEPPHPNRSVRFIKVRIWEKGSAKPSVSVNMPVALADLVFKALPDQTKADLRKEGYDVENFWARLKALGPMQIVEIKGKNGERVQIWIE